MHQKSKKICSMYIKMYIKIFHIWLKYKAYKHFHNLFRFKRLQVQVLSGGPKTKRLNLVLIQPFSFSLDYL